MYLTQSLHRGVQQSPHKAASICGSRVFSYRETMDRVSRLAGALRGTGLAKDGRVAILALNSDRYYQALLATAWADAVAVPVNCRWAVSEIAYSLNEAAVSHLVVDEVFAPVATQLHAMCSQLEVLVHCGDSSAPDDMLSLEQLIESADPIPDSYRGGDALAGIFYTGGTTGFPKGVMLSHRNLLVSSMGCAALGMWTIGGRMLHVAPMFHLADLAAVVSNLVLGGTQVIVPSFEPVATLSAMAEHRVTDTLLVPTMIQMLVDHPRMHDFNLSSLANIMYGASPITESLLARARAAFPTASFAQGYGMTELAPVATVLTDEYHSDPLRRRSAGRAAPHALVKIVDPDGVEVPRGRVGEIVVSGDHVMLGYLNKPVETAEAVRRGWMHTGDGGFMDDEGFVFITDRIKDMIVTGGENVYSIEVENVIAQYPGVAQCAVIGVPDRDWGERVHAVVSLRPQSSLTLDQLRRHSRRHLAGYKIPRSLEIVAEFPMSGAGKILKRDLRKQYLKTNSDLRRGAIQS
jgi:acyl-CoA synthetase (AMP-forming)/AMP-acid ligase II